VTEFNRSGEDDVTQDAGWLQLGASTIGVDFDAYMSVDQEFMMCGVLCMAEMCGVVGSGSCVEEGQGDGGDDDDEAASEPAPSFTEALCAFESIRAFMYAHDITKRDRASIVNIERLLFS
jgi:hypothetical protein